MISNPNYALQLRENRPAWPPAHKMILTYDEIDVGYNCRMSKRSSSSDSRSRIQRQTGNCQAAAAHWLGPTHAAILVHAGPLPGSGDLRCLSRPTVTKKSQPARIEISVALLITNGR